VHCGYKKTQSRSSFELYIFHTTRGNLLLVAFTFMYLTSVRSILCMVFSILAVIVASDSTVVRRGAAGTYATKTSGQYSSASQTVYRGTAGTYATKTSGQYSSVSPIVHGGTAGTYAKKQQQTYEKHHPGYTKCMHCFVGGNSSFF